MVPGLKVFGTNAPAVEVAAAELELTCALEETPKFPDELSDAVSWEAQEDITPIDLEVDESPVEEAECDVREAESEVMMTVAPEAFAELEVLGRAEHWERRVRVAAREYCIRAREPRMSGKSRMTARRLVSSVQ